MVVLLSDIDVSRRQESGNFQRGKHIDTTIGEFEKLTGRLIATVASKSVAQRILADEDAFNYVCVGVMEGTWKFDGNKGMTLFSYQTECAKWSIKRWLKKYKKDRELLSLNHESDEEAHKNQLYKSTIDESSPPADELLIAQETTKVLCKFFNTASLSPPQRKCLKLLIFDNMSQAEISKSLSISREAVSKNIKRGIKNLREQYVE